VENKNKNSKTVKGTAVAKLRKKKRRGTAKINIRI
jgi:hypothetical protein